MRRRTKIVATLGPATNSQAAIRELLAAGVDVVRLNFSHGSAKDHLQRAEWVRQAAQSLHRPVGILVDLQGPKIRLECFQGGVAQLVEGAEFVIDTQHPVHAGDASRVGVAYKELHQDVKPGNFLLVDDGRIELQVMKVVGTAVHTIVAMGGEVSDHKGINLRGGGLSAPALTEKDIHDMAIVADMAADYVAISFVRNAQDVQEARQRLLALGCTAGIIAKIERTEALLVIETIIDASDGIMVARGDLGVEIGDAELPAVQKRLIAQARERNKVVITATQMMESMIHSQIPTRAEVFDVANAVLDGTDAVMLSAETATGDYPVKVVQAVDRICFRAERETVVKQSTHRINTHFERIDETIAMATMYAANHLGVTAIAALTESGSTALAMSRISSEIPIFALTRHDQTMGKMALYKGVHPLKLTGFFTDHAHANKATIDLLQAENAVVDGDKVIITKGDLMGVHGGTNALKIVEVGKLLEPGSL
ncbi:MAG: pyruvate kinase [Gammaproteobacteria bacterium]|nr:pyruvate kinase [Gammaproteobacteria bacterium]